MSENKPYTDEELAIADQAAKDWVDGLGVAGPFVTARDLACFHSGFEQGRRTPGPATKTMLKQWQKLRALHKYVGTPDEVIRVLPGVANAVLEEWGIEPMEWKGEPL